jgi:hypothetical protein
MWERWTCKKDTTYQRYKLITYFTLRSDSGFGLGDNASEGNYEERYRDRERAGMCERESGGRGERKRERERERARGRGRERESERERKGGCDFLVPLHNKSGTDQVET